MYHLPIKISRREFVELIFDIGRHYLHGYDTIMTSVILGDKFVSSNGNSVPCFEFTEESKQKEQNVHKSISSRIFSLFKNTSNKEKNTNIMDELVPQIYSVELAHVVTVLAAKYNEDNGYKYTYDAVVDTQNRYVIKMEWEIGLLFGFQIQNYNFITVIGDIIWKLLELETINNHDNLARYSNQLSHIDINSLQLSTVFWDLSKEICMNKKLLHMDPTTVVIGTLLLYKMGKLRAIRTHKERIFREIMNKVSHEYEFNLSTILKEYIAIKEKKKFVEETVLDDPVKEIHVQIPASIIQYMYAHK